MTRPNPDAGLREAALAYAAATAARDAAGALYHTAESAEAFNAWTAALVALETAAIRSAKTKGAIDADRTDDAQRATATPVCTTCGQPVPHDPG